MYHDAFCLAPVYISNIVTPDTHLPGRAHLRSAKNGDYNTPHVLSSFAMVSVRFRCLDLTLGTVFLGSLEAFKRHLKAKLFSRAYGVSLADSSITVYG